MEVTSIADPRELAGAIAKSRPDLLLVDATFPGIDLDTLVTLVKPHAETYPVVLFSDRPTDEIGALVPRIGAKGAVAKAPAGLRAELEAFLKG
jgi:DNA-binding response OmpR family regulator